MNYLNNLTAKISRYMISRAKNNDVFAEYHTRARRAIEWKRQAESAGAKQIKDWKMALMAATDPDNPRRGELMRFYAGMLYDNHLGSLIDNRILPVQCAPVKLVDDGGNEDTEALKLIQKPWYLDLVRLVCNSTFEGTKLIELFALNEKMELAGVGEIPPSNFLPQRGIVIREEWDDAGVSYKEGFYKDFYVQIGSDWHLGMLNQLAVIVIAKKLGLGSWMNFIEKFGVPPIFAVTNRLDATRRDELFEMLSSFQMNQFAVLQGDEKIEVPGNYNIDAHNTFKSLITDIANAEMSKRILGSTGMTDEKSFVGSAEVGERLFRYRTQVDKLLFRFYFNEEIKPRLVKLSPVYAPLEKLTLTYDESETLTIKEIIAAVSDLSGTYDFDAAELAKITGLPITGIKNLTNQPPTGSDKNDKINARGGSPQKKKINAKVDFNVRAATWEAAIDRVARQLFRGELSPENLNQDFVLKTYADLNKTAAVAWGQEYYTHPIARRMRDNLIKFAGAKTYQMLDAFRASKTAGTSEDDFVRLARSEAEKYNGAYLDAERAFTANSANSARDWQQFVKDKDIYKNLRFRTMGDENVRDSHRALEGVVRPLNDSYWQTHTPPLGFRCRCWLEQTNDPATEPGYIEFAPQFAGNPGVAGEVFNQYVSYFQIPDKKNRDNIRLNTEGMKRYSLYKRVEKSGDYNIYVNDFSDQEDLDDNLKNAMLLTQRLKKDIYIQPHANDEKKNPEYGIGKPSIVGDLKTFKEDSLPNKLSNFIHNSATSSNNQGCSYLVMNLDKYTGKDLKEVFIRRACGTFKQGFKENIKYVACIKDGKVSVISRKDINDRKWNDFFEELEK